jgi:serine phosphatase RsbU (regulator of sigma subunit)
MYSFPTLAPPPNVDQHLELCVNLWSAPADGARLGGDWCDVYRLSDTQLALAVFDVAGHGEPAAATMQALRSVLFMAMRSGVGPSAILSLANAVACARVEGLMVTALVGVLDSRRREFSFANAGHPPPLLMTAERYAFCSKPIGDLPLGVFPKFDVALQTFAIPTNALLVLYTDGLVERHRDIARGERELAQAARAVYGIPVVHAARTIAHRLFEKGYGDDDAALIAVRTSSPLRSASRLRSRADRTFSRELRQISPRYIGI